LKLDGGVVKIEINRRNVNERCLTEKEWEIFLYRIMKENFYYRQFFFCCLFNGVARARWGVKHYGNEGRDGFFWIVIWSMLMEYFLVDPFSVNFSILKGYLGNRIINYYNRLEGACPGKMVLRFLRAFWPKSSIIWDKFSFIQVPSTDRNFDWNNWPKSNSFSQQNGASSISRVVNPKMGSVLGLVLLKILVSVEPFSRIGFSVRFWVLK
jgi:hypothetical protein